MRSLVVVLLLVVVAAAAEVNKSNLAEAVTAVADDDDDNNNDGGFPTLDGMLHWAIGHSDPAQLQMKAHDALHLSSHELQKRQQQIKDLVDQFEHDVPSDAKLMQIAIHDFNNSSLPLEHHLRALDHLLLLVEEIHNANAMHQMGGLSLLIEQGFSHSDAVIRITSAWILGKASQNNPLVQNQLLQLGALPKLMTMVKSSDIQEAIKALYAVSAIIRNNHDAQHSFYTQGGDVMLQAILGNATADVRLHKRSVSLVADLAEYQLNNPDHQQQVPSFLNGCALVTLLTTSDDLDLQEKILLAVKNLLMVSSTQERVVDGFCGLKEALEKIIQKSKNLNTDYAIDVQGLCNQVNMIYLEKLNKVSQVPT